MLGATLVASLTGAPPALAAPYTPGKAQKERPVAGVRVKPGAAVRPSTGTPLEVSAPVWPAAASVDVELGGAASRLAGQAPGAVRAGSSPVWVEPAPAAPADAARASGAAASAPGNAAPTKLRVRIYDHAASTRAGADALLFRVSSLAGDGPAKVSIDYSAFRGAHGADWAQRLRLTALPECALTTPDVPGCQGRVLESANDARANTVSATVAVTGSQAGGALLGVTPGPSSPAGDYTATSLASAGVWSAGTHTGEFSWNYPLRTPPGLGGPAPTLALAYSSASVDGRMAASNNQPSWVGEGFDLDAGYIERKYQPCQQDMGPLPTDATKKANNTVKNGDLCWATDNATLAMSGHAGELLRDSAGAWHLRSEDGTRITRETSSGNGARNGEYWVVTTGDGVRYYFGDKAATTLKVPVAGNHPGEPCHATAFADSFCTQAWRWYLDHVVDPHGNTMTYSYTKETNKYAKNLKDTDAVTYDRAAYLERIDYGTRTDRTESAPMHVEFESADRCAADCGTKDATHWTDVPWDQSCDKSPCKVYAPTFWTTKRLSKVTTFAGTDDVESWTLSHSYPNPGDGTRAGLWLDRISHKGLVGASTDTPDIVFTGTQLNNRVDTTTDQYAAMNWWRIKAIDTESGGKVEITYSDQDCVPGSRMPDGNNLKDNHLLCYPVKWVPDGKKAPILDYFHKYVVRVVTETDLTGGAPRKITKYDYVGEPAWHYTDDDGLIGKDYKTWSVWRGYGAVRETKGDPGSQTSAENRYYRGMGGTLPAAGGAPAITDEEAFAGQLREKVTFNGPGGAEVSAESYALWQSDPPTVSRTVNGSTVHARYTGKAGKYTRTALDGGRPARTTTETTRYDAYGAPEQTEDLGDDNVTGDEKCVLAEYARNTAAWMIQSTSRQHSYAVTCAKVKAGGLTDADVLGDDRTFYDGGALGAAPTKGDATRTESLRAYNGGNPTFQFTTSTYDAYGRGLDRTDVRGNPTRTVHTPAAGGPVTQVETTEPLGWKTTKTFEPGWGSVLVETDPNQRRTEHAYDGLGRTVGIWKPGRDRAGGASANITYAYLVRTNAPTVITTRKLNASGGYAVSHQLHDGLLRLRQNQVPDAAGSARAVVTDTLYDTAGRATRVSKPYLSTQSMSTDLIRSTEAIPVQDVSVYDGAARITAAITLLNAPPGGSPGGTEKWRTSTSYGGDRIDSTPPEGDTVMSKVLDAAGKTAEVRQYHAGVPAGSTDPAGYDATRYAYTAKGQLSRVTGPGGNHWDYTYDLHGKVRTITDPDKGTATSTYDEFGQEQTTKDARGNVLAYTYDPIGRRTSVRDGSVTGPVRAEWVFDTLALGKLTKAVRYVGGDAYAQETVGLTADYQPTTVRFTVPGTTVGGTYDYVYTYNQDGSPYTAQLPVAGDVKKETLKYGYDALGQSTTVRSGYGTSAETDLVTTTGYTSFGEVGAYTLRNNNGNVVGVTRTYESDTRRLAQVWTSKQTAPTDVADVRYSYDPAGNVTRTADLTSGDTQCFRSDHLRRTTDAWTPADGNCAPDPTVGALGGPAKYWHEFGFDLAGNRTSFVEHAAAGNRSTTYTIKPGTHQLTGSTEGTTTRAWRYDEAGNTVSRPAASGAQTLTWDAEGHLARAVDGTGTTQYTYDVGGGRLLRTDPAGTTLYLPGQEIRYTAGTGVKTGTRYYKHAGSQVAVRAGSALTWLSSDHHGTAGISIAAVSQAVSVRRDTPFGGVRSTSGTWPAAMDKGFVGGTNDNTGLTHLGAREYDPGTGRFISVDPEFNEKDPQQLNAYVYSNNNPSTLSDPAGTRWSWGKILTVTAIVVAVVAVVAVAVIMPAAIPLMMGAAANASAGALAGGSSLGMAAAVGGVAAVGEAAAAGAVVAGAGVVASGMYMGGKIASGYAQGGEPGGPAGGRSPSSRRAPTDDGAPADHSVPTGARPFNPANRGRDDGEHVFSGHGSIDIDAPHTIVPEGTTVHVYARDNRTIEDRLGNRIERGVDVRPRTIYRPGDSIPAYLLHPIVPQAIQHNRNPWVVDRTTRLSTMLRPNMGTVHWAACACHERGTAPPEPPMLNARDRQSMRMQREIQ
ncbi:putative adhesin [Longispora urticae]